MNTTATAKIALTALAAPVLAGLAIGLASTASADTDAATSGVPTAQDTVTQLKNQGFRVVVNTASTSPLSDCTVISTRQDHRIARANHGDIAAYVDVYCPPATAAAK
ncbi:hypothetical protein ACIA48_16160 [Mycobacterium sp. NPDC051804]|uniref:hypothetical protein n=1 Tax=Mycobacterium sp. NPDC051804 TaxID=3364295 RepID=UPI0037AC1F97